MAAGERHVPLQARIPPGARRRGRGDDGEVVGAPGDCDVRVEDEACVRQERRGVRRFVRFRWSARPSLHESAGT